MPPSTSERVVLADRLLQRRRAERVLGVGGHAADEGGQRLAHRLLRLLLADAQPGGEVADRDLVQQFVDARSWA